MKVFYSSLVLLVLFLLGSCAQQEEISESYSETAVNSAFAEHRVSSNDALGLADKVLGKTNSTRASFPSVTCVLNPRMATRSESVVGDTLAYIINYPDEGFVIVSGDNRVYPVLAFSETGYFSLENLAAKNMIVDNLETFISDHINDGNSYPIDSISADQLLGCASVLPPVDETKLNQKSPFDKYVAQVHPGCPVGCCAVAMGIALLDTQSSTSFTSYHGETFNLEAIRKGLASKYKTYNLPSKKIVGNGTSLTYEQAADKMAKLLYYIAEDIYTEFYPDGSLASIQGLQAWTIGQKISMTAMLSRYNLESIVNLIRKKNSIVIMSGEVPNVEQTAHCWVADGCLYCMENNDPEKIFNLFLHIDWGWGGGNNGYYQGDIFNVNGKGYISHYYLGLAKRK